MSSLQLNFSCGQFEWPFLLAGLKSQRSKYIREHAHSCDCHSKRMVDRGQQIPGWGVHRICPRVAAHPEVRESLWLRLRLSHSQLFGCLASKTMAVRVASNARSLRTQPRIFGKGDRCIHPHPFSLGFSLDCLVARGLDKELKHTLTLSSWNDSYYWEVAWLSSSLQNLHTQSAIIIWVLMKDLQEEELQKRRSANHSTDRDRRERERERERERDRDREREREKERERERERER